MSRAMSASLKKRLRKHEVTIVDSSVTLDAVYQKYSGKCQRCCVRTVAGLDPQKDYSATIEHKKPLAMGGNHTWDNVTLLCHKCNSSTNDKLMRVTVRRFVFFGYEIAVKVTKV